MKKRTDCLRWLNKVFSSKFEEVLASAWKKVKYKHYKSENQDWTNPNEKPIIK